MEVAPFSNKQLFGQLPRLRAYWLIKISLFRKGVDLKYKYGLVSSWKMMMYQTESLQIWWWWKVHAFFSLNKYYGRMIHKFMSWVVALLLVGCNGGVKIVAPLGSTNNEIIEFAMLTFSSSGHWPFSVNREPDLLQLAPSSPDSIRASQGACWQLDTGCVFRVNMTHVSNNINP